MFDQLKDMGKLMKKAKEMKGEMKKIQGELKEIKIVGKDKKELAKVALTGEMDCVGVQLSEEALNPDNKSRLEKAIQEAFNQAAKKAKTTATSRLSSISQGLNIPGLS